MGRKKKDKSNDKRYFTEVEEIAIIKYNNADGKGACIDLKAAMELGNETAKQIYNSKCGK